ncbi:MAG: secondary thiamine-phosphate synthase enzyme YjbQ [Coriobacteriia bacterium]|nr:secondary thiamine-phosphate synthase enzyme YjbQ [Coriobacteriia bacterium]
MTEQYNISLNAKQRGFNLITNEINIPLPEKGILNLFIQHTSAGLAISENYDPDVQVDLENIFNHLVPENQPYYTHTIEGSDDMPSHAKSILVGPSLSIPIQNGKLALGTWQGIYLCEFRNHADPRKLIATIIS